MFVFRTMADDYQVQSNGHNDYVKKPLLELYVKVSLYFSFHKNEALRPLGLIVVVLGHVCFAKNSGWNCLLSTKLVWLEWRFVFKRLTHPRILQVKTVNVNSEAFKKNFLGAQPPIMIEEEKWDFCFTKKNSI